MALLYSGQTVELREVVLRDKPACLLKASPKATVPVLVLPSGDVLDESIDIMRWALNIRDPDGWLTPDSSILIKRFDDEFKGHLDRYKYSNRYEQVNATREREAAFDILLEIEPRLRDKPYLFGDHLSLADVAIAPFVRQFANTDRAWFDNQSISGVQRWLSEFLESTLFTSCMQKYSKWTGGDNATLFPASSP
jgi:glutathione S-transferase